MKVFSHGWLWQTYWLSGTSSPPVHHPHPFLYQKTNGTQRVKKLVSLETRSVNISNKYDFANDTFLNFTILKLGDNPLSAMGDLLHPSIVGYNFVSTESVK